jgi:hypothetical protein
MSAVERLYVVYNADSDWWSLLVDVARKLAGRDECPLCTLTHGATGERASWRACKEALGVPVEPVHRDELTAELRALAAPLPYVAARAGGSVTMLLDRDDVVALGGRTEALEARLRERAEELGLTFNVR